MGGETRYMVYAGGSVRLPYRQMAKQRRQIFPDIEFLMVPPGYMSECTLTLQIIIAAFYNIKMTK